MNCQVTLELPCLANMGRFLRKTTSALLDHVSVTREDVARAQLALSEAYSNVVKHAYDDPGRTCRVELVLSDSRLDMMVTDSGKGFQVSEADVRVTPRGMRNIGLLLIRSSVDRLEIDSSPGNGTRLSASIDLHFRGAG